MAKGIYDSQNFIEIQLIMAVCKNIFYPKSIPQKNVLESYPVKDFIKKVVLDDFSIKM